MIPITDLIKLKLIISFKKFGSCLLFKLIQIVFNFSQDYEKYNETQLFEFESVYKLKFDSIQNDFHQIKNENHSEEIKSLTEQNQLLQQKLSNNSIFKISFPFPFFSTIGN